MGIKISKKLLVPIFFLSIIIIAELVFANVNITYGLIIHLLTIFLALFSPFILKSKEADLAQAFILVSLLRLINVGMPLEGISIYYQFLVIYSLLMLSIAVYLYSKGIGLYDLGIRSKSFKVFLMFGILIGILFGFTEYTILGVTKVFPSFFLASLSVFFILGLVEELIFRGVMISSLKMVDPFSAILLSSIAFGVMHSVWLEPLEYFFTFYAGLVLALIYYKTESLTIPVVTHIVINFILFQAIPFKIL
ncbi:MAG: lysostaphin resistance A-like protein [Candidatus Hydrothermarchaeales archaeon]